MGSRSVGESRSSVASLRRNSRGGNTAAPAVGGGENGPRKDPPRRIRIRGKRGRNRISLDVEDSQGSSSYRSMSSGLIFLSTRRIRPCSPCHKDAPPSSPHPRPPSAPRTHPHHHRSPPNPQNPKADFPNPPAHRQIIPDLALHGEAIQRFLLPHDREYVSQGYRT